MSNRLLEILSIGPAATVQDLGRPGLQRYGVAQGGALDPVALTEGVALLDQPGDLAAIEMCLLGGTFRAVGGPVRVALTGAPMKAAHIGVDGTRSTIRWRTSFRLDPGAMLEIGAVQRGFAGYLHVGGGIETPVVLGSRATHLRAGLGGGALRAGMALPVGPETSAAVGLHLEEDGRFRVTELRAMWGPQAHLYSVAERERFAATTFRASPHRDRMAMQIDTGGDRFEAENALSGVSDAVSLGDIQMTGKGEPVALLADRQPTGGYPRIATVAAADLPALAQLASGAAFRLRFIEVDEAVTALQAARSAWAGLRNQAAPLLRDPHDISDLLSYELIDGVVSGGEDGA